MTMTVSALDTPLSPSATTTAPTIPTPFLPPRTRCSTARLPACKINPMCRQRCFANHIHRYGSSAMSRQSQSQSATASISGPLSSALSSASSSAYAASSSVASVQSSASRSASSAASSASAAATKTGAAASMAMPAAGVLGMVLGAAALL
jgi:hypothetical protein